VPPNAVLTVVREDEVVDLTVMLMDPRMADSNTLVYTVAVLEGPESADATVVTARDGSKVGAISIENCKSVYGQGMKAVRALLLLATDRVTQYTAA
jgi:hypothetical protein